VSARGTVASVSATNAGMRRTAAQVRSVEELQELVRRGEQPNFLFFWGHRPSPGGQAGKGCLSQWWPSPVTVDGLVYPTAEHFMMAGKALLFGDARVAGQIREAPDPATAKALGREVGGFDEQRWARHRFEIVVTGNMAKFSQHPQLRQFLLSTGEQVLVEAAPRDRIWGIGLTADDQRTASPQHWQGLNLLGFALMEVRHRLSAAPA